MYRLFVALRPPPPIRARLAATMDGVAEARWQDDEQLHVTLRFIGDVPRPVAEEIAGTLARLRAPRITVTLAGVGRFGNALWAGLAPHDALTALHHKVDRALASAGLEPERRAYLPHVTLARTRRGATASPDADRWMTEHAGLASPPFALEHFILYQSNLSSEGAHYETVARWPLD